MGTCYSSPANDKKMAVHSTVRQNTLNDTKRQKLGKEDDSRKEEGSWRLGIPESPKAQLQTDSTYVNYYKPLGHKLHLISIMCLVLIKSHPSHG